LYNHGQYLEAKNLFIEIFAVQPSFKGTKSFLAEIEEKLGGSPASVDAEKDGIEAPSSYVKPRDQVVTDTLDDFEAAR
jgi:hypothetical protein